MKPYLTAIIRWLVLLLAWLLLMLSTVFDWALLVALLVGVIVSQFLPPIYLPGVAYVMMVGLQLSANSPDWWLIGVETLLMVILSYLVNPSPAPFFRSKGTQTVQTDNGLNYKKLPLMVAEMHLGSTFQPGQLDLLIGKMVVYHRGERAIADDLISDLKSIGVSVGKDTVLQSFARKIEQLPDHTYRFNSKGYLNDYD